jgi:alanine-glyoxylate transaminase/serine-glyoxylate transaminase/serine-pyruvate transaminase
MRAGREFLQIPGPTNIPDRVLRAMDRPIPDHRGPEFGAFVRGLLPDVAKVFGTRQGRVVIFPTSGTGAWEAALVNTLAPGDRIVTFDHGYFANLFTRAAEDLGIRAEEVPVDQRRPVPAGVVEDVLRRHADVRAVLVVHNETSTGVRNDVGAIRRAMDAAGSDALLIVDTVSSLASTEFRFDEWRVDVALTGSQKGLMLPPGLGLLCVGPRALAAGERGGAPRSFFDWRPVLRENESGFFPYTPATLTLYGLRAALDMLFEEGLPSVYARHRRLAGAVRAAVRAWGMEVYCLEEDAASDTLTGVVTPERLDSGDVIATARERFGLSLGVGLGKVKGKLFRIGHLGSLNELEVIGTIAGVEMALAERGVAVTLGSGATAAEKALQARERITI